jgi:hypothetical protein
MAALNFILVVHSSESTYLQINLSNPMARPDHRNGRRWQNVDPG